MKNRLKSLTPQNVHTILLIYLSSLLVVFLCTAFILLTSSDALDQQIKGLGMLLVGLGLSVILLTYRSRPDWSYRRVTEFFETTILRRFMVLLWVVILVLSQSPMPLELLGVTGTPEIHVTTETLQIWMPLVALFSLITYVSLQFHFLDRPVESTVSNRTIIYTTIMSMTIGFAIGILRSEMHVAVEQGQVLAGIVHYSPTNPWYMYQAKLWNFWAIFSGAMLSLGITEIQMSLFLSGLAGALMMTGFALISLTVVKNSFLSVIVTLLTFAILEPTIPSVYRIGTEYIVSSGHQYVLQRGFGYPLLMYGSKDTYGILGINHITLVIALFALRRYRLSFFLLGFSVFIHPSLGIWLHAVLFLYILIDYKNLMQWIRRGVFVVFGYIISVLGFIWQRTQFPIEPLSIEMQELYLDTIIEKFSTHGKYVFTFDKPVEAFILVVLIVCAFIIFSYPYNSYVRTLMRITALILFVGIFGSVLTQTTTFVSDMIAVLLPNRFVNMTIIIISPIIVSLITLEVIQISKTYIRQLMPDRGMIAHTHGLLSSFALLLVIVIFSSVILAGRIEHYSDRYKYTFGISTLPVYTALRETEGLLLIPQETAYDRQLQAHTRRPLLFNIDAIDGLPYTVEAGPYVEEILDKIYGIDFFSAPRLLKRTKIKVHERWSEYSVDKWQELSDEFGIQQVLFNKAWGYELQLPLVAEDSGGLQLYQIPQKD